MRLERSFRQSLCYFKFVLARVIDYHGWWWAEMRFTMENNMYSDQSVKFHSSLGSNVSRSVNDIEKKSVTFFATRIIVNLFWWRYFCSEMEICCCADQNTNSERSKTDRKTYPQNRLRYLRFRRTCFAFGHHLIFK